MCTRIWLFVICKRICKKIMNTATKTGINVPKKIGDKYGKNLMDTEKKTGILQRNSKSVVRTYKWLNTTQ